MQHPTSLPLTAEQFAESFHRITAMQYHLSAELRNIFQRIQPLEEQAATIRHRMYQALRYNDCKGAWAGLLDDTIDVEKAYKPSWLRASDYTATMLHAAPTFIRVNSLRTTVNKCLEALAPFKPIHIHNECIRIDAPFGLFTSEAFANGWFEQQDVNSQRVGSSLMQPVLNNKQCKRIVDLCAGAGGKALHLAALTANMRQIFAFDTVEHKLELLRKRASRAGASNIETRHISSTKVLKRQYGKANLVLVDAPCSGSGVLRRNPDILYHLSAEQIDELIATQAALLDRAFLLCKPGGHVAYVTCSIFPEECEQQVGLVQSKYSATVIHEWRTQVDDNHGDGFYFCLLQRVD